MSKKPIALVDMDGTLCDYASAMYRDMLALASPEEREKISNMLTLDVEAAYNTGYLKARMDLIKRQPEWWYNLEKLPQGFKVVNMLRTLGFKLTVLTRGPRKLSAAWEQKHRWCLQNLPDADISIVSNKASHYGRVLVDDWIPYVDPWLTHRKNGTVIMPAQPWNEGYSHPQVIRHTINNDDEVFAALKLQRERK